MAMKNSNTGAFFEIVSAGLWEKEALLSNYENIDYSEISRLADEQSVTGLVAAGIEHVHDVKTPQDEVLQFVGSALQIEQRNISMNEFIAKLISDLRKQDVYAILVKGQGVAQCYEKPLWRSAGDIDLYLSKDNYDKAKEYLLPLATEVGVEDKKHLHLEMNFESWVVELHGTLHTEISNRMNIVSDEVFHDIFYDGNVRSWNNNGISVFLPSPNNDVIIIFNHFINHFYGEGIGLRQICDWCRLLWTYRDKLNHGLLESRIRKAGLITEWKAFATFAIEYLGMPREAMPFYCKKTKYSKKAAKIARLIIETGSFGTNKDYSYRNDCPKWKENILTFFNRLCEFSRIATIFPCNAPKFFVIYFINRVKHGINR